LLVRTQKIPKWDATHLYINIAKVFFPLFLLLALIDDDGTMSIEVFKDPLNGLDR
jgi:hypothetical protein